MRRSLLCLLWLPLAAFGQAKKTLPIGELLSGKQFQLEVTPLPKGNAAANNSSWEAFSFGYYQPSPQERLRLENKMNLTVAEWYNGYTSSLNTPKYSTKKKSRNLIIAFSDDKAIVSRKSDQSVVETLLFEDYSFQKTKRGDWIVSAKLRGEYGERGSNDRFHKDLLLKIFPDGKANVIVTEKKAYEPGRTKTYFTGQLKN